MIFDFSHFKMQDYVNSDSEREQLAKFFAKVHSSSTSKLTLCVETQNGSKLQSMILLQMVGDTIYLTDEHEAMAVIDLALVKSIEIVG